MDFRTYQAIDAVNWSRLKLVQRSPRHYAAYADRDSDTLRTGRALHSMVLGGDRVVAFEGVRRGREWADFQALHASAIILKSDAYETASRMANAVHASPLAAPLLADAKSTEHVLTWTDARTGLRCKAMADLVTRGGDLVDLKSAVDASPHAFGRAAGNYGYHRQLAWYARGYEAVTGNWPRRCLLVVAEKDAPFDVGVYEVDFATIMGEQTHLDALLARVRECVALNEWPGVTPTVATLELPSWAVTGGDDPGPDFGGGDDE